MEIQQFTVGTGTLRRPPFPGGPLVEVLLSADDDSPVGIVHVRVAAGGGMPEHDHGASTVVLIPLAGAAQLIDVADDGRTVPLLRGTITTIPVGRRVRLDNPGGIEAQLLVVVSPPDFAQQIAGWPAAANSGV